MKTYLTEYKKYGKTWTGPRIEAISLREAQHKAPKGVKVIGELHAEVEIPDHALPAFIKELSNKGES